jgi:hypothetical protein
VSDAQQIISLLNRIFGGVELPLCISIMNSEGMDVFSTKNCEHEEIETTNVLGLMAFEELSSALKRRAQVAVQTLIFRTDDREYFLTPVGQSLYMCAIAEIGKIGQVVTFLEGLSAQIDHALRTM